MLQPRMFAPTNGLRGRVSHLAVILALGLVVLPLASFVCAEESPNDKPLPPEDVSLKTTDGKAIAATFYPSREGKNAAAVILIHSYGNNRQDMDSLARKLQLAGSAVIAPDLRGHGDSSLGIRELHADDYASMVRRDLEAVKGLLMQKNNLGELNIDRLGIVGVELGASLALNWAALDWSWPVLPAGKQGQDVKALALISPEWAFKGIKISDAVVDPAIRTEISLLIVTGRRNAQMLSEAKRLYNSLAKFHNVSRSLPVEEQTLFLRTPPTSLQGMALLKERTIGVEQLIIDFVDLRLIKPNYPWQMRMSPL